MAQGGGGSAGSPAASGSGAGSGAAASPQASRAPARRLLSPFEAAAGAAAPPASGQDLDDGGGNEGTAAAAAAAAVAAGSASPLKSSAAAAAHGAAAPTTTRPTHRPPLSPTRARKQQPATLVPPPRHPPSAPPSRPASALSHRTSASRRSSGWGGDSELGSQRSAALEAVLRCVGEGRVCRGVGFGRAGCGGLDGCSTHLPSFAALPAWHAASCNWSWATRPARCARCSQGGSCRAWRPMACPPTVRRCGARGGGACTRLGPCGAACALPLLSSRRTHPPTRRPRG